MSKDQPSNPNSFLDKLINGISTAYKHDSSLKHQVLVSTLPSKMEDKDFDNTLAVIEKSANVKDISEAQKLNLKMVQNALSDIRGYNKAHSEGESYTYNYIKQSITAKLAKGGRE